MLLRRHAFWLPALFLMGFGYGAWYAEKTMQHMLPASLEGKPIQLAGVIASMPNRDRWQQRFMFAVDQPQMLIRLSWRKSNTLLRVGDRWRLLVRLKRIHGTQNPGAFDYEAWALQRGLNASGYVVNSQSNRFLSHRWYRYPIEQWRQYLYDNIQAVLPSSKTAPWLLALMIGERASVAHDDWRVLRNTGTNHLMAIAGLHIGILSEIMHYFTMWWWRRCSTLSLRMPAQHAGAIAAWATAIFYSAIAGFSIPAQRASIMLMLFVFVILLRRQVNAWQIWSRALLVVLLINPLSVLTESFWLSFGTIALIIYGMSGRLAPHGWWWKWGRVQWVIGIGLLPLTLLLFQECSLISFAANCAAIPWLAFLILPGCLLSGIFLFIWPAAGAWLLQLTDMSLGGLWMFLSWCANLPWASMPLAMPSVFIFVLTVIGFLLLLVPAGFPGRWLGLFFILPLACYQPLRPAFGEIQMTLLDVGQGLAVVVETKNHVLVYDAGPAIPGAVDAGESVVLPFLRTRRYSKLDKLIISHGDNDHIGGARALLDALPVGSILSSVPDKISVAAQYCLAGDRWVWDGVTFAFLYPDRDNLLWGNDSSCVLRIENNKQSVLLAGDIEKYAEQRLLQAVPMRLSATVLAAPHHGSKTSGLRDFIQAVHPAVVLYATGYRNRYHFPHESVITQYHTIHSEQWNTVNTGAVNVILSPRVQKPMISFYRTLHRHYWFAASSE